MLLQHLWQASHGGSGLSKEVVVKDLRPGMVLTSDIYTNDGILIVPTGTKISLIILKKLHNLSEMSGIKGQIFIEQ